MLIQSEFVRQERAKKSLTQQELADACDLSLRTIQRVENQGVASLETCRSLCAVLECTQEELLASNNKGSKATPWHLSGKMVILAFVIGLLMGFMITRLVS